jgi:hypothetical protein
MGRQDVLKGLGAIISDAFLIILDQHDPVHLIPSRKPRARSSMCQRLRV